ncbi:hypothetical protein D3C83_50270 [compost metagenome]
MMIHNQPTPGAIPVDKTESSWTTNWLTSSVKSGTDKGVGPGVDCNVTIDSKPLLTQDSFVIWRRGR